jgi:hypothetical protein
MQQPQPFGMGDRVRTVRTTNDLPQGSYGTVVRVLLAPDCCDVRFDAYPSSLRVLAGLRPANCFPAIQSQHNRNSHDPGRLAP